jgi:hypothetical protein
VPSGWSWGATLAASRRAVAKSTPNSSAHCPAAPLGLSLKDCEDLSGHVALETADGFLLGLSLTDPAGQVLLGLLVVTQPGDHDPVQGGVGLAIPTPIEPKAAGLARGGLDRGGDPHSIENAASERSLSGLSPAATNSAPAPDGWTKTFTDPRLCAAIVDRLTFGGNIIETGTDSYRLAHTRALHAAASGERSRS